MSVDELGLLHNQYIDLSNRFRSAWTYQQFLAGLHKMVPHQSLEVNPEEFQRLHSSLRGVSLGLNASEVDRVAKQLESLRSEVDLIVETLLSRDQLVSPSLLRQFFQRVRKSDNKIVLEMVKFFVYTQGGGSWERDRLDKVDYLLTRASEQPDARTGVIVLDRGRMMAVAQALWRILGARKVAADEIRERCELIQGIQSEMSSIGSFEELEELNLVARYRQLKAGVGNDFFEPATLMCVLEANLALKNRVRDLQRSEEAKIVAEYQQIFDLHRETQVDTELEGDLSRFHENIEHFEQKLQKDEIRLEELAQIRDEARRLKPRLSSEEGEPSLGLPTTQVAPPQMDGLQGEDSDRARTPSSGDAAGTGLSEDARGVYDRLLAALEDSDLQTRPRSVILTPEVFPFALETREVTAYRRLLSSLPCDRELERFLLESAAIRVLLAEEIAEIGDILDDTAVTRDAPVFEKARASCRQADLQIRRFGHHMEEAVLACNVEIASDLQMLRMRLMRELSELWLLGNRDMQP